MNIEKQFHIEAVTARDEMRPALTTINIGIWQDKPVAVAADGRMLVVIPITLDDGDVPGMFPAAHLTAARKLTTKSYSECVLALGAETTMTLDGTTRPRKTEGTYPDYSRIITDLGKSPAADEPARDPFITFDSDLLGRMAKALGDSQVLLYPSKSNGPIIVKPANALLPGDLTKPPFGVLMPVSVADSIREAIIERLTVAAVPTEQSSEVAA